jgi:hypothetical protein
LIPDSDHFPYCKFTVLFEFLEVFLFWNFLFFSMEEVGNQLIYTFTLESFGVSLVKDELNEGISVAFRPLFPESVD